MLTSIKKTEISQILLRQTLRWTKRAQAKTSIRTTFDIGATIVNKQTGQQMVDNDDNGEEGSPILPNRNHVSNISPIIQAVIFGELIGSV
jgi:hypothetical protein